MVTLIRISKQNLMNHPPLGLLYVGDALKKGGYEPTLYHICEDDISRYVDRIVRSDPLWVGFSVNTGWSMRAALEMSREIKKRSSIPIVWGNAHPSLLPEQCLEEDSIDHVVIGEGEVTAVELTKAIVEGDVNESIKGIGYKTEKGEIVINERREFIKDLDQYAMDWSLLDPEKYVLSEPAFGMKRAFSLVTSRGCPHSCAFCYNQEFNGRQWRAHSAAFVVRQVSELKESLGLDGIRFWDDNFFTKKDRAFSILEEIDLPYTTEIRVDYFDESFTRRVYETKCRMILLGFESGSNRVLNLIKKGTTTEVNHRALQLLSKYPEVAIHPAFIVGFPTETEEEYKETLEHFAKMIRSRPNFWFVRLGQYVPYPGCELYDLARARGLRFPEGLGQWDDLVWDTSKEETVGCVEWASDKSDIMKDEEYLKALHSISKSRLFRSRLLFGLFSYFLIRRLKNRSYKFEIELASIRMLFYFSQAMRSTVGTIGWPARKKNQRSA
jgi:radical SAM superfamily enzyme YgiQ (UPF0313 family)